MSEVPVYKSMEEETKTLRRVINEVLEESELARASDPYLIAEVFKRMGWSTDLETIAQNPVNRFDSISRLRRMAQKVNPMLKPGKQTTARRIAREEAFKKMARGV